MENVQNENNVQITFAQELQQKEQMARAQFELSSVGQMLKQFEVTQRMAQMYSKSGLVPKSYQGNLADCAIAVDMAIRMNCNPVTVMQNLVIVQGRPTWQSQFLVACINKSGRFTTLQYATRVDGMVGKIEYEDNEWDNVNRRNTLVKKTFDGTKVPNLCCKAYATDLKTGEVVYGTEISIKMAVQERWYTKSGSKWQTMAEQMLKYRAAAFFQRVYAPEISMGFHTSEEIEDAEFVDVTPKAQPKQLTEIASNAAFLQSGIVTPEKELKPSEAKETAKTTFSEPAPEPTQTTTPKKTLL